ncbi:transposase, partial [Staphylococcus aureus]|uniref:transposase n=1 Tax=Staphylococcus aureus TaxID=1280 RepID=UPI001CF34BAC
NNRKLVLVDRLYPSTQICSVCGYRKTKEGYGGKQTLSGDNIHHNHQKYYCYNCGAILDRDENAVENIKNYAS